MFSAPKLLIVVALVFLLLVLPGLAALVVFSMRKETGNDRPTDDRGPGGGSGRKGP